MTPPDPPSRRLLDAEAEHREAPRTYSIPRRAIRESLQPGDLVKLLFPVDPPDGWVTVERMWVEVVEVRHDAGYVGRLDNEPGHVRDLKLDDLVSFGPEHVAARYIPDGHDASIDPSHLAIVSRRIWTGDAWPRRLERRAVPNGEFSGWILFAGDESPDFIADPSNFEPIAQGDLLDRFPVLDAGLEGPVGTVMTWDAIELEYREA